MTTLTVATNRAPAVMASLFDAGLPQPTSISATPGQPATFTWTPDLTAQQATTLALLDKLTVGATLMTPAERTALEPQMVTGRAFLALSQAEFIALAQNARDRMLFDNVSATWRVIFRLLRDS